MQFSRAWIIFMAHVLEMQGGAELEGNFALGRRLRRHRCSGCDRQGIVVAYTPGLLNEAVADFAFGLLLAIARRIHLGHLQMSQGEWKTPWGHDVHGKTLGIIGCGRIGSAMARRASGFQHARSEL